MPEVSSDPGPPSEGPPHEQFRYDDGIVRAFGLATMLWGIVAMLVGLLLQVTLDLSC